MQLIIDDGAPLRTSRQVIFNPSYRLTGIATCAHKSRTMMASLLYTDYYQLNEVGKQKVAKILNQNPTPIRTGPKHVPGTDLRPLVRGVDPTLDRAIYYWQNKLRTDPKDFLNELRKFESKFIGKKEAGAAKDAMEELEKVTKGLPALEWNEGLNLSARDHCADLGPKGLIGHFGSEGSSPFDRISKYGRPGWWRGENLSFNNWGLPAATADVDNLGLDIVLRLFVDEGVAGRPNRSRMLNPEFKMVGIQTCAHKTINSMTVLDYSGTLETNELTKQELMAAQESNFTGGPVAGPKAPAAVEEKRCSDLPSSVVTRYDCAFFDMNNDIR